MKKKILNLLIVSILAIIIFSLTGCNNKEEAKDDKNLLASDLKEGDRIYYYYGENNENKIECVVLYDSTSEYGIQVITADVIEGGDVTLGVDDPVAQNQYTDELKAQYSYNNAIKTLNDEAQKYLNKEMATSARCVGSNPANPNLESGYITSSDTSYREWLSEFELKTTDENYLIDEQQIDKLHITSRKDYWYASRKVSSSGLWSEFLVRDTNTVVTAGLVRVSDANALTKYNIKASGISLTKGFRPVFTLIPSIEVEKVSQ